MQRRQFLRGAFAGLAAGVAGCSASESPAPTETRTRTPTRTETATPDPTATATATPTPGERSLRPYRSWLVAPTPPTPHSYEFTRLSLSAVRADASATFAEQLNTYWRQRAEAYFGVAVPVDAIDSVLTVNHSRVANESYRVLGGAFDTAALRGALADADFAADGRVADFQRFVRTQEGQRRVVGLHPDVIVTIGAETGDETPLATAVTQHDGGDSRADESGGLDRLIDHFGTADYVTARELDPEVAPDFPLSEAVATGRHLDVRETTSWAERAYVFPPDATVERAAFEDAIRTNHVGQPTEEYARDGRIVTVAGPVANSLIRLL